MTGTALRAAHRVRIKDDVLSMLREAILRGEFAPGERLGEVELSSRLDVSRGPIRDALAALANEGLVTQEPHRGATIPLISRQDVHEIYSLRVALEVLAAEQAVTNATLDDLHRLKGALAPIEAALERGDRRAITEADLRFHDYFYDAAHHERLQHSWRNLRSQVAMSLFSRNTVSSPTKAVALEEHASLLHLLEQRDVESLVAAVREHILSSQARLLESYP